MPKPSKSIDFSKAIELMTEGVILDDENENIIYANEAFCKITGYSPEDVIGKKSYIFWDKESEKKIRQVDRTLRKRGISSTYECVLVSKEGENIPVLASGAPRPDGGTVGIITDLRFIKENEQQAAILGHAIEKSSDGYILFDEDGKVLLWNTGAQDIFGYSVKQADKLTIQEILGEQLIFSKHTNYLKEEIECINKKGDSIFISVTIEKLINISGQYLCTVRDITQYRELQQGLLDRYEKIQSAYVEFGSMRRKMEYIYELSEVAQKCGDLEEFGQFVISSIVMLTGVDGCVFRVKEKKHLQILSAFGVGDDWWGRKKIPVNGSIAELAFQNGPQKVFDSQMNTKYKARGLLKKHGFTSMMVFGLTFRGDPIGSITLHLKTKDKWHIFEDGFLVRYIESVQMCLGALVLESKSNRKKSKD